MHFLSAIFYTPGTNYHKNVREYMVYEQFTICIFHSYLILNSYRF